MILYLGQLMIALALLWFPASPWPQFNSAARQNAPPLPFETGEELLYEAEYTWFLIRGANIAELRLRGEYTPRSPAQTAEGEGDVWRFSGAAVSKGALASLFGVRFQFSLESTVEPQFLSALRTKKLDERNDRKLESENVYDHGTGRIIYTERDLKNPTQPAKVVPIRFSGSWQDIVSVLYFARTLPLKPGDSFEVPVVDSGKVYQIPIRVREREKLETTIGDVWAVRIEADVFGEDRLLGGKKGELVVWVTDDARHIPVKARVNLKRGRLDIKLSRMGAQASKQEAGANRKGEEQGGEQ